MMQKSPWSEIITILHIPIGHGCKYNPQIGQYTQFGQHTHRQYAIYSMQYRNVMHWTESRRMLCWVSCRLLKATEYSSKASAIPIHAIHKRMFVQHRPYINNEHIFTWLITRCLIHYILATSCFLYFPYIHHAVMGICELFVIQVLHLSKHTISLKCHGTLYNGKLFWNLSTSALPMELPNWISCNPVKSLVH